MRDAGRMPRTTAFIDEQRERIRLLFPSSDGKRGRPLRAVDTALRFSTCAAGGLAGRRSPVARRHEALMALRGSVLGGNLVPLR